MKLICIVPSAGKGRRLREREDKPFVALKGKPLLSYTLKALEGCRIIDGIIVAVSGNKLKAAKRLVKKYKLNKVESVVRGGKKRINSVKNALAKVRDADFVLIHDGVRPFVEEELVNRVFTAAKRTGAALSAIPSTETVKLIDKNLFIVKTPNRKSLWKAQTPQVFRKDLILDAYKNADNIDVTDDAALVERMGHKVKVVKGSHRNIKITTREDLELAKVLMRRGQVL